MSTMASMVRADCEGNRRKRGRGRASSHNGLLIYTSYCTTTNATEYLYASNTATSSSEREKSKEANNKCQSILAQVGSLCEDYPGYCVYVSGHSLGMALATLFAAEAAACSDPRVPKPVSVIGIASPKVGNRAFLQVFQVRLDVRTRKVGHSAC